MRDSQSHSLITNAVISVTSPTGSNVGVNVQVETNSTGIASFSSCEVGAYDVKVTAGGFEDQMITINVPCNSEDVRIEKPILLVQSCACADLKLNIFDNQNDAPLTTSIVTLNDPEGTNIGTDIPVDPDGSILFESCKVGEHEVFVTAEGYTSETTTITVDCQSERFSIEERINLTCDCVTITLNVINSQNNDPVTNAMVSVTSADGSTIVADAPVASSGVFMFETCQLGELKATVQADGFLEATSVFEVSCEPQDVIIPMPCQTNMSVTWTMNIDIDTHVVSVSDIDQSTCRTYFGNRNGCDEISQDQDITSSPNGESETMTLLDNNVNMGYTYLVGIHHYNQNGEQLIDSGAMLTVSNCGDTEVTELSVDPGFTVMDPNE